MSDVDWIDGALTSARPQADRGPAALLPATLDLAEEAFQDACLRGAEDLAQQRPSGANPTAWLIFVGPQRRASTACASNPGTPPLPPEEAISDLGDSRDRPGRAARRRPVPRRRPCACCSSAATRTYRPPSRFALALRIVVGPDRAPDRPRLPGQRKRHGATHQPAPSAGSPRPDVPFEAPGPVERAERLGAVAAMVYLVFNEGLLPPRRPQRRPRAALRRSHPAGAPAAAAVPGRAGDAWPDLR